MSKKKFLFGFIVFSLFLCGWQSVKAFQQKTLEDAYYDLGYKSVSDALRDAEDFYKTDIQLPKEMPPLDFTHSFGRFSEKNQTFEIEYLNEKKHFNYIINIFPAEIGDKLLSHPDSDFSTVPLEDGTLASHSKTGLDNKIIIFIFNKNNWTYMLCIKENLLEKPLQSLVKIANSL